MLFEWGKDGMGVGYLLSPDFQMQGHLIALADLFRFLDDHFDRHQIATVFGKQGCRKLGLADPHVDGDHPPAIRHETRDRFDLATVFCWNRDEQPRGGTSPVDDLARKFNAHGPSISNARR